MSAAVSWNAACRHHYGGAGHPERPQRFEAVLEALRRPELQPHINWIEAAPAARAVIERAHPSRYIDMLAALAARGGGALDADTFMGPRSWESILAAAGGNLEVTGGKELRVEIRLALASHSADAGRPCGRGVAIQG